MCIRDRTHTAEFYDFYRQKLIVHGAKPNAAHLRLAKLEREGKCKAVVTQNIDGLHQAAGLLRYFRGETLVVINKQPTPADGMANLILNMPIGQALDENTPVSL